MNQQNMQALSPEEMAIRAKLAAALEAWLAGAGLTQTAAAAVLGVTQARVSEIKHGKTAHFSLDLLVRLAARAGLAPRLLLATEQLAAEKAVIEPAGVTRGEAP